MDKELKNDLVVVWNEIEEVNSCFHELTDEELIDCRSALKKRLEDALHWLDKYVDEEDVLGII